MSTTVGLDPKDALKEAQQMIAVVRDMNARLVKSKLKDFSPHSDLKLLNQVDALLPWLFAQRGGVAAVGAYRELMSALAARAIKKKEVLAYSDMLLDRLAAILDDLAPLRFVRWGLKFENPNRYTSMTLEAVMDSIAMAIQATKKAGLSSDIWSQVRSFVLEHRSTQFDGAYQLSTRTIALFVHNQMILSRRMWIAIHELGHSVWYNLPPEARKFWMGTWHPVSDAGSLSDDQGRVRFSYEDRMMAAMMLASLKDGLLAWKSPLALAKIGSWLESAGWGHYTLGEGLHITKNLNIPQKDKFAVILGELDMDEDDIFVDVPRVLLENNFKTERDAKDWLQRQYGLPSEYAKTSGEEDFSESFALFVTARNRMTSEGLNRMQRVLWLAGWHGKPISASSMRVTISTDAARAIFLKEAQQTSDSMKQRRVDVGNMGDIAHGVLGDLWDDIQSKNLTSADLGKRLLELARLPEYADDRVKLVTLGMDLMSAQYEAKEPSVEAAVEERLQSMERSLEAVRDLVTAAQKRVSKWQGALATCVISPSVGPEDLWEEGAPAIDVSFNGKSLGFTIFLDDGASPVVEDVLEGGDRFFFKDLAVEADYFSLINEIRKPGSTSKGKWITLYTARPTKDREQLDRTGMLPPGIFLADNARHVLGLATDLSSRGVRDVWRVQVNTVDLVQTLFGGVAYYQLFGNKPIKPKNMTLVEEGV